MSTDPQRATGARRDNRAARPAAEDSADRDVVPDARSGVRAWFDEQVSWLSSSLFHAIGLMVLALIPMLPHDRSAAEREVVIDVTPPDDDPIPVVTIPSPPLPPAPQPSDPLNDIELPAFDPPSALVNKLGEDDGEVSTAGLPPDVFTKWAEDKKSLGTLGPNTGKRPTTGGVGIDGDPRGSDGVPGGVDGRRNRGPFGPGGPTPDTEAAVQAALAWLAAHQLPDGSWSFDHRDGVCNGRCKNHGQFKDAKNAATGLALLTFLGAGETHLEGRYQKVVDGGLRYLVATQKIAGATGSWHEKVGNSGNYSHSIATLAVCEALAMAKLPPPPKKPAKSPSEMTEEERRKAKEERERAKQHPTKPIEIQRLAAASQAGVNYIVDGQHSAGGWRYNNGQAGDTSVVGWMLMALKSGHLAKVRVPGASVVRTSRFLDSVQEGDYGSIYHYMAEKNRPKDALRATTAIGLLCRMYLGWDRNHPGIAEGVTQLGNWKPSAGNATNMYYNYYATQVMHHYGGEPWRDWNRVMREHLVKTQAKDGHEKGSWHFTGDHGAKAGGRLYATTLAAMTLEVYYRYLPIYKQKSVEDDLQGGE